MHGLAFIISATAEKLANSNLVSGLDLSKPIKNAPIRRQNVGGTGLGDAQIWGCHHIPGTRLCMGY